MGIAYIGKGKTWFKEWKEARNIAKEKKFEKMRAKYEATTSKRGTNKVHAKPKREPKEESDRVTYEKGDDYESDFEEEA